MAATTDPQDLVRQESKRVVRIFQRYTSQQCSDRAASHRLTPGQRCQVGEFFYRHPDLPGLSFATRRQAATAAVRHTSETR